MERLAFISARVSSKDSSWAAPPRPSRRRGALIALALLASSAMPGPVAAEEPRLSASVLEQIRAVYEEKASWGPGLRKLGSQMILEMKGRRGEVAVKSLPRLRSKIQVDPDGKVLVDIRADVNEDLLLRIGELGGEVTGSFAQVRTIRARMPLDELESLAAEPAVRSVRAVGQVEVGGSGIPSDVPMGVLAKMLNTSQGDVAHDADVARATYGVDGSGVQVAVIADGVDSLATVQASGDLPMGVTVLAGQAGSGDAGTALLEIVHDLAPGAELLFSTASGGEAQLAQNILDLAAAGADVIVDNNVYFAEGVFQDDVVAEAVNQVAAGGVHYFAGNSLSGNLNDGTSGVWEGDFAGTPAPAAIGAFTAHDFGGGANYDAITVDSPYVFTLKWADPLGGSANDYDLFLLDSTRTAILDASIDFQDGDDDPFEIIDSSSFDDTGNTLVIIKYSGADRFLHLNTHQGVLQAATAGQIYGHGTAADAFSVAAVDVATASGSSFTGGAANPVEVYNPDGPRRIFFEADGTAITPGNFLSTGGTVRQEPDVAAATRVSTATPGFSVIFGTSPAAAHAGAIAALMLEKNPDLTPAQARSVFAATALDIEAAGVDRDSGVGIVMADEAVANTPSLSVLIFTDGFESGNTSAWATVVQ